MKTIKFDTKTEKGKFILEMTKDPGYVFTIRNISDEQREWAGEYTKNISAGNKYVPENTADYERFSHTEMARITIQNLRSKYSEIVHDGATFWYYDAASFCWKEMEETQITEMIREFDGKTYQKTSNSMGMISLKHGDITGILSEVRDIVSKKAFFDGAEEGVNCWGKFLYLRYGQVGVKDNSHETRSRYTLQSEYNPNATAPMFQAFLDSVFAGDSDKEDKINFIQELCGASLFGVAARYQTAAILLGEGANGKSTLLNILSGLFPKEVTTAVPPAKWDQEYYCAKLDGSLLNIVGELPLTDLRSEDKIKGVISGDLLCGRKPYGQPVEFCPRAGHFFSANRLPGTRDLSQGFWRRFVIINFNQKFEGENRKVNLDQEILSKEEEGIFAWMVEGMKRLVKRGHYEIPMSSLKTTGDWKHQSDTVWQFYAEMLDGIYTIDKGKPNKNTWVQSSTLYMQYTKWCKANGHQNPVTSKTFAERLKNHGTKSGLVAHKFNSHSAWNLVEDTSDPENVSLELN